MSQQLFLQIKFKNSDACISGNSNLKSDLKDLLPCQSFSWTAKLEKDAEDGIPIFNDKTIKIKREFDAASNSILNLMNARSELDYFNIYILSSEYNKNKKAEDSLYSVVCVYRFKNGWIQSADFDFDEDAMRVGEELSIDCDEFEIEYFSINSHENKTSHKYSGSFFADKS